MSALTLILATTLLLASLCWLWRLGRHRVLAGPAPGDVPRGSGGASRPPRPAILVFQAGGNACGGAIERNGRRCIADRLEVLPLRHCNARRCTCHFQQQPDQRRTIDRRAAVDRRDVIRFEPERDDRRISRDRRLELLAWSSASRL